MLFRSNLDEVIGWHPLLPRQFFRAPRAAVRPVPRQPQHRAGGVVALDGQFHAQKLGGGAFPRNQINDMKESCILRATNTVVTLRAAKGVRDRDTGAADWPDVLPLRRRVEVRPML